ncbi:hypothetical protein FDK32_16350 [Citrobacter freundii]|uniref:hypothetical protein n=1 Tax=Citrobacter freundii TaxID=546 RepID=UPI001BA8E1BB|nr:hypothetical protein [Citrobacter freundii]MBQ5149446.1 hypothetical protein [Citrobacter freundii]
MTPLNEQAYRVDGGDIGVGRLKEIADNAYGDEEKRWLAQRVLALLDEMEKEKGYASAYEGEKWHYHQLAESEGERANRAEAKIKAAENNLIDSECHVAELEESLRDKQELLEAAEKRISDLETKKADLMAHVLNGYEATALTMTLRKMDVYLPDYLRFCAIYSVDHDALMDKLDYQSFVLARVNNDDLRQDIEASHD